MSGWYYPPPQPTQLAPHVVQASTGQNPPIKALAAAAAAIISLWPVGYDHSAYAQDFRAKQTAPLTLVYGQTPPPTSQASFYEQRSQWTDATWTLPQTQADSAPLSLLYGQSPPITSRASLYGQRAQWADVTWTSPQSPPEAAVVPRVDNPPLIAAWPVFIKDPARPIYGLTWQYGTQNAKGDFSGFSIPPAAQPPPIIGASVPNALASWPNPTWPAQDLGGPIVQPYPGDEPPGSLSVPDLAAYAPAEWRAQNAPPNAGWNVPAALSPFNPSRRPPYDVLSWWMPSTWSVQTESDVQPLAAISYGSQPTPTSIALQVESRAAWTDATWAVQTQSDAAEFVAPPVVNNPQPVGQASFYAIRAAWTEATWGAQTQNDLTQLPVVAIAWQPSASIAGLAAIRATWLDATWNVQSESDLTPLQVLASAQPSTSTALQAILRAAWADANWSAQTASDVVNVLPRVDAPPSRTLANLFAARGLWANPTWSAQGDLQTVSWFGVQQILVGSSRYIIKRIRMRRWIVSATTYLQFDPKAPDENVKLTFDFSPDLPSGITLTGSPVITYSVKTGADLTPNLLANGTPGFNVTRSEVIVPVQGGINGCDYAVHALCATTDPLIVLSLTGILSVRS